jgi:hypothetical protein
MLDVDAELAKFDDRRSTPADRVRRERQREGHPVRFAERLAVAHHAVMPRRRFNCEAYGLEPADELSDVLPHLAPESHSDQSPVAQSVAHKRFWAASRPTHRETPAFTGGPRGADGTPPQRHFWFGASDPTWPCSASRAGDRSGRRRARGADRPWRDRRGGQPHDLRREPVVGRRLCARAAAGAGRPDRPAAAAGRGWQPAAQHRVLRRRPRRASRRYSAGPRSGSGPSSPRRCAAGGAQAASFKPAKSARD